MRCERPWLEASFSMWDTAAGATLAREAGCLVITPSGEDLTYDLKPDLRQPAFLVVPADNRNLRERLATSNILPASICGTMLR